MNVREVGGQEELNPASQRSSRANHGPSIAPIHPSILISPYHHINIRYTMAAVHVDRPTPIQSLIDSVERYNPDNVQVLEDYLATQCKNGQYDLQANLALLKL